MAAPYYIIDTYAMLAAFMTQDYIVHRKIRTKLLMFVQKKWPFLLHHLIIAISYPIIVVSDVYIGSVWGCLVYNAGIPRIGGGMRKQCMFTCTEPAIGIYTNNHLL